MSWRSRTGGAFDGWAEPAPEPGPEPEPAPEPVPWATVGPPQAAYADRGTDQPDLLGGLTTRPTPARGRIRTAGRRPAGRRPDRGRVLGSDPAAGRPARGRPAGEDPADGPPARGVRRVAVVLVGALVAGLAMLVLRAGTEPTREPAAATTGGPVATPNSYARAYVMDPPFDRLPGRTPIPEPAMSLDRRTVEGRMPAVGDRAPGPVTAMLTTELVLGRYCRSPESVELGVEPLTADWTRVRMRAARGGDRPAAMNVYLTWDPATRAYGWTGATTQLASCS